METSTPRAFASAAATTPRPELICTMCSFAPASPANQRRALDRFHFGHHWPRRQKITSAGSSLLRHASRQALRQLVALRVNRNRQVQIAQPPRVLRTM